MFKALTKFLIIFFVMALLPLKATGSQQFENQSPPQFISFEKLQVVGSAKLSVLFWDVYQSTLYTSSGRYDPKQKDEQIVFNVEYLRDIERDELIEHTEEQWQHLGFTDNQYLDYLAQLKLIWPNLSKGDSLTLSVSPQQSIFYFNKEKIGVIDGPNFGAMFLSIWLSPETSRPKLRKQLIGAIK